MAKHRRSAAKRRSNTKSELREALKRLIRRQLHCARAGEIGTPVWHLAFKEDLEAINAYCRQLEIYPRVPALVDDGENFPPVWVVDNGRRFPCQDGGGLGHSGLGPYLFDPDDPNTIPAVNRLAVHTLSDWLEDFEGDGTSEVPGGGELYRPASWFKPAKIKDGTLRQWKREHKIKVREVNRKNHYSVQGAAELHGMDPRLCIAVCSRAERKALGFPEDEMLSR